MLPVLIAVIAILITAAINLHAEEMPRVALKYRTDLTRQARSIWGLNAPIPALAAQIHQESQWNPQAVSYVGAIGMAQFMPETVKWVSSIDPSLKGGSATNPTWAIRALVSYDYWLTKRVWGNSEYDDLWAALRAYNGGLGHWQMEAKTAQSNNRPTIDAACGRAKRAERFCAENLGYPHRILNVLQPLYFSWGARVQP